MRFSIFPLLLVSAGLAQYVAANPIRVVVTEISNIRLGHAVAHLNFASLPAPNTDGEVRPLHVPGRHGHHQHAEGGRVSHCRGSMLRRVRLALGPWEGRAVAFVLGCGIGVLLRMVWVLAVISYRMIRGQREEEEYHEVIFIEDAEELILPPPQYTDDKVQAQVLPVDVKPTNVPIAPAA